MGEGSARREGVRNRSEELRAESARLIDRCRQAVAVATGIEDARRAARRRHEDAAVPDVADARTGEPDFYFDLVPIIDLFQIWVDNFGLSVVDAVQTLAVQLALSGYPIEVDGVAAADAIAMTHRVSEATRRRSEPPSPDLPPS